MLQKLPGIGVVGLMLMVTAAVAAPPTVAPVLSTNPVLIADQCPPGTTWVAGGYTKKHHRWIEANCVDGIAGSTAPAVPTASPVYPGPPIGGHGGRGVQDPG